MSHRFLLVVHHCYGLARKRGKGFRLALALSIPSLDVRRQGPKSSESNSRMRGGEKVRESEAAQRFRTMYLVSLEEESYCCPKRCGAPGLRCWLSILILDACSASYDTGPEILFFPSNNTFLPRTSRRPNR